MAFEVKKCVKKIEKQLIKLEDKQTTILHLNNVIQEVEQTTKTLCESQLSLIDNYHKILKSIESERSEKNLKMLKTAYKKIETFYDKLPADWSCYFERLIEIINESTVKNVFYYDQICSNLSAQAQEYTDAIIVKILNVKAEFETIEIKQDAEIQLET